MKEQTEKKFESQVNYNTLDDENKKLYMEIFEEYDAYPIFSLREVARRMGVKSATTMDKRTLVTAMTELRMASTVYYPPEPVEVSPVTVLDVEQITGDYLMRSLVVDPTKQSGILDISRDGAWLRKSFLPSDKDVFVPMLMVNEQRLVSGDEIEGLTRFMEGCGRFGLFRIETLNGKPFEGSRRVESNAAVSPTQLLRLSGGSRMLRAVTTLSPIAKGQRKLIVGEDALRLDTLALELSGKLSEAGLETVNLFLDQPAEAMPDALALKGKTLALACEDFESYEPAVRLAVAYAKSIASAGRDVAIVLNNAEVLTEETLRTVFGAGKNTASGSITAIIFSAGLEINPVINKLSRTANSVACLKNNYGDEPMIDARRSFSDCEILLDKCEIQTLKDCRKQLCDHYVTAKELMTAYEILLASNKE